MHERDSSTCAAVRQRHFLTIGRTRDHQVRAHSSLQSGTSIGNLVHGTLQNKSARLLHLSAYGDGDVQCAVSPFQSTVGKQLGTKNRVSIGTMHHT